MGKLSTSPDRGKFRQAKTAQRVGDDILEMLSNMEKLKLDAERNPEWAKNNLEYDLRTTEWILEKVRASTSYAQNLYAALCNNEFQPQEMWEILKDVRWSCSWRYAGGIIADMCGKGDYMDWYCSGSYDEPNYVGEGQVTEEILADLLKLKWNVVTDNTSTF